jgi:hypothetical protein
MPDPSTLCRRTTSEMALRLFQGWPAHRAGGLRPSSTILDTPHRTSIPITCTKLGQRVTRPHVRFVWRLGNSGQELEVNHNRSHVTFARFESRIVSHRLNVTRARGNGLAGLGSQVLGVRGIGVQVIGDARSWGCEV